MVPEKSAMSVARLVAAAGGDPERRAECAALVDGQDAVAEREGEVCADERNAVAAAKELLHALQGGQRQKSAPAPAPSPA